MKKSSFVRAPPPMLSEWASTAPRCCSCSLSGETEVTGYAMILGYLSVADVALAARCTSNDIGFLQISSTLAPFNPWKHLHNQIKLQISPLVFYYTYTFNRRSNQRKSSQRSSGLETGFFSYVLGTHWMPEGLSELMIRTKKWSTVFDNHILGGRSKFSSTIYTHFPLILKAFSPLFNFLLSLSPQTEKVVKMFWVFHLVTENKWDFFAENSAEKLDFSNQW
jgi:hypothetical protein